MMMAPAPSWFARASEMTALPHEAESARVVPLPRSEKYALKTDTSYPSTDRCFHYWESEQLDFATAGKRLTLRVHLIRPQPRWS